MNESTPVHIRENPVLDLIKTLKGFKEHHWSSVCAACAREINRLHVDGDEELARLWGRPIHTDCFYRLKSMDGVTPPRRRSNNFHCGTGEAPPIRSSR